ncbi:MAG: sigma-70 family RNA polymerase sigma factor [Acidobacteria bacterium]|nr:sigma-70 family RNA polymerase sigma factor [Acidobacteriota bacterium]
MEDKSGEVTELLRAWSGGSPEALDRLLPLILEEVRGLARKALSLESRHITLEPTELVSEAYLRLVDRRTHWWRDRVQFFSALAELMRRILVDRARRQLAAKRGGGWRRLPIEEGALALSTPDPELLRLDEALARLQRLDERKYQVILLWFFVGMTQEEIARELGLSVNTVGRQWQAARRWLQGELRSGVTSEEGS